MTISTDLTFSNHGTYDDRIAIAVAVDQPSGRHMTRTAISDIVHNDSAEVAHPTIAGLIRSGENHILVEGSCECTFNLHSSVTAQHRTNYENWLSSNDESMQDSIGSTITYDSDDNTYTLAYTVEFGQPNWRQLPTLWTPKSDTAKVTFTGSNNTLLCFTRIDGEPGEWTIQYRDVGAGVTASLPKAGTHCYMIFSEDVTKGSQTLDAFVAYKITSSSIDITATNNTKVIRLYRD